MFFAAVAPPEGHPFTLPGSELTHLVPGPVNCQGSTGSCPCGALTPGEERDKINKCIIIFFSQQIDFGK